MSLLVSPFCKGHFVIERRTSASSPWVAIQRMVSQEAGETLRDWYRLHHGEWSPLHSQTGVEHRLVDTTVDTHD